MLSKKLTFSLTSIVVMLAFGLICFVPSASAHDDKTKTANEFGVKLTAAESMVDVSYRGDGADDNIQIASGRTRAARAITGGTATTITLLATFDVVVNLADPETGPTEDLADRGTPENDADFDIKDVIIDAYDKEGRALGVLPLAEATDVVILAHRDPKNPGKEFLIRIDESELLNAYSNVRAGGASLEIATLLISIPQGTVQDATLAEIVKYRKGEHFPHSNKYSNVFQVHFVDADEGAAKYKVSPALTEDAGPGVPGVVSIDRILSRSGFVSIPDGPFDVRIILTEQPRMGDKSGLTKEMIAVTNGTVTAVKPGITYKGATGGDQGTASELTRAVVGDFYGTDGNAITEEAGLPQATGRDNKYYTYSATIAPGPDLDNKEVTVGVKQFMDHVKPVSNMYVPLTPALQVATTLATGPANARNARVKNETLSVRVKTGKDTTSPKGLATVAYEARDNIYKADPLLEVLPAKLFIPAGGYLVLVNGKADTSGVVSVPDKKKDRNLTAAQAKYRVRYEFSLNNPADDLSSFFRAGGSLNLVYQDIAAATDSGHDDAKAATGDDTTDYTGASTNAYAVGAVKINEIMWGLDGADKTSQYIELHNTTTADIGIDSREWAITPGAAPTGFTVVDTVGNNPSSGYWVAPGNSGVTKASAEYPTVSSLVSMSRIDGATDATAAASWAPSKAVGSANITGARIGTPGAANSYDASAQAAAKAAADAKTAADKAAADAKAAAAKAPVASSGDVKITEIMVASNGGRLPQWIELANTSAGAVSLMGWAAVINNDPADTDVVGSAINLDLGDVVIGKGQVALIVSKAGRSSGEGTGKGDLRSDRIINVQKQVSPGAARYMLMSEMATKITLVAPPATGGVIVNADVVGNLGMGWELPMAEGNRSSLIRREMGTGNTAVMGTDAAGWVLASDTMMDGAYRETYYGQASDVGTPGYDAGGALPVELSKFSAARDRVTGQVIIAWETQSELNNAGFYIKRSQQRTGNFVVVNPTMIAGAGTTSEKQSYTYTDTTAQPNIVYYYQIEDVSLDGHRQTLTRGHRLKGHIGAAGKATTTWGDLKTSRTQ